MDNNEMTEEEYLRNYNPHRYESPSVTVDMLVFSMNSDYRLQLLLIRRGGHPFKGKWAIPGGFVDIKESLDDAAKRELKEETNLSNIYMEQLYTFGAVDRDVRKRVISVSYMACIPANRLNYKAGDDAKDAEVFEITKKDGKLWFVGSSRDISFSEEELAFDHSDIIKLAIERLKGKIVYSDIALEFLRNKEKFSIYELKMIHEAIRGEKLDTANFRRSFKKKFIDTKRVETLEEKCVEFSKKPSTYYKLIK